jgi:microsomal epoxide hydrolase
VTRDEMLANISLYWFTGAIGSSFWPYYARMHGPWPIPEARPSVPMGYAEFPKEILSPPRSLAARTYPTSAAGPHAEGRALRSARAAPRRWRARIIAFFSELE